MNGFLCEVRERIKLLILDSIGCAIYGANLEWCRILRQTLEGLDFDAHDIDLGDRSKTLFAACRSCQRHANPGF